MFLFSTKTLLKLQLYGLSSDTLHLPSQAPECVSPIVPRVLSSVPILTHKP